MMDKTTPTATPRGLRPLTVMVLAALWIATIGNLALWRALAALPELGNARGWLFGLAFALLIGAVQVAISSCSPGAGRSSRCSPSCCWPLRPAPTSCSATAW